MKNHGAVITPVFSDKPTAPPALVEMAREWMDLDARMRYINEQMAVLRDSFEVAKARQTAVVDHILQHGDYISLQMSPNVVFECAKVTHVGRVIRTMPTE